ncbi:hypothetical protein [Rhodobacter lacus]|uniref:Tail fiber protein n=1 Tax=Rhodobacter lacus TaxID=1641972 RepID=A0ABW5ABF2_9RHOB
MSVLTNTISPRQETYTVGATASTGPFSIPFPFLDRDEVQVFVNGNEVADFVAVQASKYSTEGNYVTLSAPVSNSTVTVWSNIGSNRAIGENIVASELSVEIDRIFAKLQEQDQRAIERGIEPLTEGAIVVLGDGKTVATGPSVDEIKNAQSYSVLAANSAAGAASDLAGATRKAADAAASATIASNSASTATNKASSANISAQAAASSATAAAQSEAAAADHAAAAAQSQAVAEQAVQAISDVATSAAAAETNARDAANSATAAGDSAASAAASASTADTKASQASASATAAVTSATKAASSETSAATSAATASDKAATATAGANTATAKATEAAGSATEAYNSSSSSRFYRDQAQTYSTAAGTSATAAAASATVAQEAADGIAGDTAIVRTTGDQSLSGFKKFTGATIGRPSDHYVSSINTFYAIGSTLGQLSTEGGNAVNLTSNGYRTNAGLWSSFGVGGYYGAAQIALQPNGTISFRAETRKESGTNYLVEEQALLSQGGMFLKTQGYANGTFSSRTEAAAAKISSVIKRIAYYHENGLILEFVRAPASYTRTAALTTADGQKWVPAGNGSFYHWGAVADGVTDDRTAVAGAISSGYPIVNRRFDEFAVSASAWATTNNIFIRGGVLVPISELQHGLVFDYSAHSGAPYKVDIDDFQFKPRATNLYNLLMIRWSVATCQNYRGTPAVWLGDGVVFGDAQSEYQFAKAISFVNVNNPVIGKITICGGQNATIAAGTVGRQWRVGSSGISIETADYGGGTVPSVVGYKITDTVIRNVETGILGNSNMEGLHLKGNTIVNVNRGVYCDWNNIQPTNPGLFIVANHINALLDCIYAEGVYEFYIKFNELYRFENVDTQNSWTPYRLVTCDRGSIIGNQINGNGLRDGGTAINERLSGYLSGCKRSLIADNRAYKVDKRIVVDTPPTVAGQELRFRDNVAEGLLGTSLTDQTDTVSAAGCLYAWSYA